MTWIFNDSSPSFRLSLEGHLGSTRAAIVGKAVLGKAVPVVVLGYIPPAIPTLSYMPSLPLVTENNNGLCQL